MKLLRWIKISLSTLALATIATVQAQGFPERPITMIVPFTPGGVSDITARPLAIGMANNLGHNIVIDNRGGAGGAIGMSATAKAKPDGYTLMMALPSIITIPISDRISGRPSTFQMDQFKPIARLTADPTVLAVRAESKWNTLADFIRDAKAQPGKISYSSSGIYGTTHVAMEILANTAGLQMIHVPFSGGGQQIQALLAGQVDATMQTPGAIAAHIASGKLRLLTAMSRDRIPSLPDLPTARELGHDGEFYLWTGVFAPVSTPDAVVNRLRTAVKEGSMHPAFTQAMAAQRTPVQYLDSDDFARFLQADTRRLDAVLTKMGKIE
jgi:tripartite-type tricarboxylate transporter receptor subunit TctC